MEILGERPAWSMNDTDKVSRLDATVAVINSMKTYYLQLVADLDASGYAKDIGAGDTARFLSQRYLIDPVEARRDLRLATALPKYEAVADALPDPAHPFPDNTAPDTAPTVADDAEGRAAANDADGNAVADEAGGNAVADEAEDNTTTSRDRPLNLAQAAAIVSALEKVPNTVLVENLQAAERQLVKLARTFTPKQLRDAGARMRTILDTDGPEPDENRARQRESLTLKPADNGVKFTGYLANDNAELFRTLIHAGAKPHKTLDGEPDPRARDKRQADALTSLLTTAAGVSHTTDHGTATNSNSTAGPTTSRSAPTGSAASARDTGKPGATSEASSEPTRGISNATGIGPAEVGGGALAGGLATSSGYIPGHGPKAHLTITIDYHALKTATADAIGDTVFGDALSAAAVRRLACDAQVIPVVLGSKSQPLDVGTTKRLVTGPMRLALNARDRGCVVCGAPPIQCEAHHLIHWIDGGDTSVSNLVLLCKRHHIDLHSGHWHIEIIDGVVHVTRPTWATPDPIPRGRYKPTTHNEAADESSGAARRAWTHEASPGQDATPDVVHLAIWGDEQKPAGPGPSSPSACGMRSPDPARSSTAASPPREDCRPGGVTFGGAARLDPWGDDSPSARRGASGATELRGTEPRHPQPTLT